MLFGRYLILACTVKYLRIDKTKPPRFNKKSGKKEPVLVPMYHRHVWFIVNKDNDGNQIDDGMVWRFTSSKRGRWSDSRDKSEEMSAKPIILTDELIKTEIARLTTFHGMGRIWQEMNSTELTKSEYADLIGAKLTPFTEASESGEETEKTLMEGGLLDRIVSQSEKSKANSLWSKTSNR